MTVIPLLALLLLELGLRVCGAGYATKFFVPTADGMLTTNPKFAWQYLARQSASAPIPTLFKPQKEIGTKRVFVLGESAAAGTPDPAYSFSRMLGLMLEDAFPSNRIEIINAAMRGIDSHVIRQIAMECADLSPDLFIVYAGNNEMIGLHSPAPGEWGFFKRAPLVRFEHAVKRLRMVQLLESALRAGTASSSRQQDMTSMRRQSVAFDDPAREIAYRNFERNLEDICAAATGAGAKTIVCSVAVNLRDMPPLQSLHRSDLAPTQLEEWSRLVAEGAVAESSGRSDAALASYRAAAKIDDHHAELLYRIARCEESLGDIASARQHFGAARDWDALQFRADSKLNGIARTVATRFDSNRVAFVDVEQAVAGSALAPKGIPGAGLFQEHVHFTFDGDHLVASTLLPPVTHALGLTRPSRVLTAQACAVQLAFTKVEQANIYNAVAQMTSKPPFLDQLEHGARQQLLEARAREFMLALTTNDLAEAEATYRSAIARRPDDWMLHYNFARFFTETRRYDDALPEYERVVKLFPHQRSFRLAFGMALLQANRSSAAESELHAALKLDPDFLPARQALAAATRKGL